MITPAQKAWLDAHPEWEIVGAGGAAPSGEMTRSRNYHKMLALRPDGTAVREKAEAPSLLVGVRRPPARDPAQTVSLRR